MTPDQEKQWREEFEKHMGLPSHYFIKTENEIEYRISDIYHDWCLYLAARQKAQEEIDNKECNCCGGTDSHINKYVEKLRNEIKKMKDEFNDVYLPMHALKLEKRDKLIARSIEAIKAYQELNSCYQLSKRPSEKLFDRIAMAKEFLKDVEALNG